MLEVLLCAASAALNGAPATVQAPPPQLLEFIGDWRDDEAKLFLDPHKTRQQKPLPSLDGTHHQTREPADEKK